MKEGVALRQGRKSKEVQKRPIIVFNVCFTKIRSEHSNNTLLSLLRIFMKQTLFIDSLGSSENPVMSWTVNSK